MSDRELEEEIARAQRTFDASYASEDSGEMIAAAIQLVGLRIERALIRIAKNI